MMYDDDELTLPNKGTDGLAEEGYASSYYFQLYLR